MGGRGGTHKNECQTLRSCRDTAITTQGRGRAAHAASGRVLLAGRYDGIAYGARLALFRDLVQAVEVDLSVAEAYLVLAPDADLLIHRIPHSSPF